MQQRAICIGGNHKVKVPRIKLSVTTMSSNSHITFPFV